MSSNKKRVPLVYPALSRGTGKTIRNITVYNGGKIIEKKSILTKSSLPKLPRRIEKKLSKTKRTVSATHENIKRAIINRDTFNIVPTKKNGMILKIQPKIKKPLRAGWEEVKPIKVKKPLSDDAVKALMAEGVMGLLDYVQATIQLDSLIIMKNNAVKANKMEKAANLRAQEKDALFRLKSIEKRLSKIRMKLYNF